MRVIVCGSRDWTDAELIASTLGLYCKYPLMIVHGACMGGADLLADKWAEESGVPVERHPADWAKHGKAAGPIRNQEMAALGADLCIAFWDGESRGTLNMIVCATREGIPVRIVPRCRS